MFWFGEFWPFAWIEPQRAPTPSTHTIAPSVRLAEIGRWLDARREPDAAELLQLAGQVSAMEARVRTLADENLRLRTALGERDACRAARDQAVADGMATPIEPFLAERELARFRAIDGGAA
jgi:hypothetical protein